MIYRGKPSSRSRFMNRQWTDTSKYVNRLLIVVMTILLSHRVSSTVDRAWFLCRIPLDYWTWRPEPHPGLEDEPVSLCTRSNVWSHGNSIGTCPLIHTRTHTDCALCAHLWLGCSPCFKSIRRDWKCVLSHRNCWLAVIHLDRSFDPPIFFLFPSHVRILFGWTNTWGPFCRRFEWTVTNLLLSYSVLVTHLGR